MTNSNTVKSLAKKHAEIQGNTLALEKQLLDLREKLKAIEISINLFDPSFRYSTISAKRTNQKLKSISRGEIPKLVGDFVRKCSVDFQASDIVSAVLKIKGREFSESDTFKLKQNISKSLKRLSEESIIHEVGRKGKGGGVLWRIAR